MFLFLTCCPVFFSVSDCALIYIFYQLVNTIGASFPLQGRDETIDKLFKGGLRDGTLRRGLCERFENRKSTDRNLHPILLLASGPGTGKSRILQELQTLLRDQAGKYTRNDEFLKMIKNQMYTINVTFGNGTRATMEDSGIGSTCELSMYILFLVDHVYLK